jgi:6-pyruvoyltetrahydropterin/6-carboxytetrahydropterin synthase
VTLEGDPVDEGMVADFAEVKSVVKDLVLSKLDHSYLNDVIEQPTAEYISQWIFRTIDGPLKRTNCSLYEVRVWETENSSVICRREDI